MQALDCGGRVGDVYHTVDGGHTVGHGVERGAVDGRYRHLETVAQRVVLYDLLDLGFEHAAELLVVDLLLLVDILHRHDTLDLLELLLDGGTAALVDAVVQLGREGYAVAQVACRAQGRCEHISYRSHEEEHQRDAHGRYHV